MLVELDDEVVAAAQKLADQQGATVGRVISELAWRTLVAEAEGPIFRNGAQLFRRERNGFLLLDPNPGAPEPTMELVNELRDEE